MKEVTGGDNAEAALCYGMRLLMVAKCNFLKRAVRTPVTLCGGNGREAWACRRLLGADGYRRAALFESRDERLALFGASPVQAGGEEQ